MMTLAVLRVAFVGGFCIVLGVVIAVRIVLEERRVAQASASKADLLKEYEDIKREKTVSRKLPYLPGKQYFANILQGWSKRVFFVN